MTLDEEPTGELRRSDQSDAPEDQAPVEPPSAGDSAPTPAGWRSLDDLPPPAPPRDATSRADKRRNQRR